MAPPPPLPTLLAMLICVLAIKEAGTNKHSAIGIFTDIFATKFPMVLNPLGVYCCVSDALGVFDLAVELVDLHENRAIGRIGGLKLQSKDKLATHDFGIRFMNTIFPRPGTYEFRILADGRLLGAKSLRVRELKQAGGPGGPGGLGGLGDPGPRDAYPPPTEPPPA